MHLIKSEFILKLLRFKFGDVPEAVAAKVQSIDMEAELDTLLERVLQANTRSSSFFRLTSLGRSA
jgi:hypothetical protein